MPLLFLLLLLPSSSAPCVSVRQAVIARSAEKGLRPLTLVTAVRDLPGCLQLCFREQACVAIRHNASQAACRLFASGRAEAAHDDDAEAGVFWLVAGFQVCSPDHFPIAGGAAARYFIDTDKLVMWHEARELCAQRGGQLAHLRGPREHRHLLSSMAKLRKHGMAVWVGPNEGQPHMGRKNSATYVTNVHGKLYFAYDSITNHRGYMCSCDPTR